MKILLIDPPGDQKGWNAGLAYLSGALSRAGIEHAVLDMVNAGVSMEEASREIASLEPDIVGLSVKTATYYSAVDVAEMARKTVPEALIIAGGPHVTLYHEEFLREARRFDVAIVGEAEETLVEFVEKADSEGGTAGGQPPAVVGLARRSDDGVEYMPRKATADLDALPPPEFGHHINFNRAAHPYPLVTSRGCPYGCIFCSVGRVSGPKWRSRSPESVVDELERAKDRWGFDEFDVLDDTFTQDTARAVEICRLIKNRNIGMRWSCPNGIRADLITPELLAAMVDAGCHTVIFGVESADPQLFASIRKGEELENIEAAIRMAKAAGLRVGGFFIIGLPGDSFEKNMRGLEFAEEVGLDWAHFNILAPYPGTKVWDEIARRGRFLEDYRKARHFSARIKPIFELEDFKAGEIADTYKTVHVRQGLYHLILPPDLPPRKMRREARRLRMKYDREAWLGDIGRDVRRAAANAAVPLKALAWEFSRGRNTAPAATPKGRSKPDKLRILFVNDYIGRAGGAERYIYDLTENLGKLGHRTAWAYQSKVGEVGLDTPVYEMSGLAEPAPAAEVDAAIDRIMSDFDPDIIHIHNVHASRIVEASMERRATLRTAHDHNIVCPSMNKMWATGGICDSPAGLKCLERLLDGGCHVIGKRPTMLMERLSACLEGVAVNKRLPRILVATGFMREELVRNGFDRSRVESLPLFIDFPAAPAAMDDSGELRILWAGRMVLPDKGADFFIDTLKFMRAPYRAVMAGGGPHEDFVRRKAAEAGLGGKLEFRGKVSGEEMERLYRWCHVVAFTAVWAEPFGYVGVEAAAHGRPVAAFDVGGVSDWLEDRAGGFLVQRGNCRALALRLDRMAYNAADREKLGKAHFERAARRHDKTRHLERLMEIYRQLLA